MSKAIEFVHNEVELEDTQLVRGRLVATIAIERNVTVIANGALDRILQRIFTNAKSEA